MNNVCELKSVSKSYYDGVDKKLIVLEDINLKIKEQSQMVISGESGSGKSTLLYLLGGLDNTDSGEVRFHNKKMNANQLCRWRSQFLGFVFQFHYLLPDFSALENIYLAGMISQSNSSKTKKQARELLNFMNLSQRENHRPFQLSGGEQQRVAIARALINSPQLILADEPTGNLDFEASEQVFKLLQKICKEKKSALVLVTHNRDLVQKFSTHYHLASGCLKRQSKQNNQKQTSQNEASQSIKN